VERGTRWRAVFDRDVSEEQCGRTSIRPGCVGATSFRPIFAQPDSKIKSNRCNLIVKC